MQGDEGSVVPSLEGRVEGIEKRFDGVEERVEGVETEMRNLERILVEIRDGHLSNLPSIARDVAWIKPLIFLILAAIVAGAIAVIATD